jgi:TatD DNase family protein
MSWFDTHCHLQSSLRNHKLQTVLQHAHEKGVKKMVTVGTSPEDWTDYQKLAQSYPNQIYYSAGLHPGYVDENWTNQVEGLENFWKGMTMPVALGEVGLDFFRLPQNKTDAHKIMSWQREAFRYQLKIAQQLNCPVIIHSRSAFNECIKEIDEADVDWEKVVFHCFTEGIDQIKCLMNRGGRASFTGIVTFSGTEKLLEAVAYQGTKKLMLETDSPYLAPVPFRGQENEPARIPEIACKLSSVLGELPARIEEITYQNSLSFYGLDLVDPT